MAIREGTERRLAKCWAGISNSDPADAMVGGDALKDWGDGRNMMWRQDKRMALMFALRTGFAQYVPT